MLQELNIGSIIKNAIEESEEFLSTEHILSNISAPEVISLTDESNTLKVVTSQNDIFSLDESSWKQISSNDEEGFSTFVSLGNETAKILIDEAVVDIF